MKKTHTIYEFKICGVRMRELIEKVERGYLFCKTTDIADIIRFDKAQLRGMAVHIPEQLPFNSFVIGKNIKFSSLSVLQQLTGINYTSVDLLSRCFSALLAKLKSGVFYCTPAEAAKVLHCDPNTLRSQAAKVVHFIISIFCFL